jgi:hypothetical protein
MRPRLSVSSTRGVGGNSKSGFMKQDGSFELEGIAPGNYQIRVEAGIRPVMALGSATVEVDDHDVEGVTLTVHAPRPLRGVIRTEGDAKALPPGLSLWLDSSEGLAWAETTMPLKDGSFDFENVPWGQCRVHVRGGPSGQYYLKTLRYGGIESSDMAFSLSGAADTMELTLSAHGTLVSGVVKRNGAGGSTTARVVLLPDTSGGALQVYDTHLGVLDQSGAFTVKDAVRPGEYTLYAFEGVPDGAWTDAAFIKGIDGKGVRIKVGEGDAETVEVPLIPRSDIVKLLTRLGMD